ncbi:hypothetical protein ARMGADRAFT_1036477 [Armillaria gallica]|uniref:Uncharacterized protein n=1 Tax=Armillaria gallica TaxID=47427 RepID=A0A2H3CIU6_ARMGA|nr:hypothetical protein ARMGADRAFT_1041042 [Armillaria gallica]PBK79110.1 hypothetical protein ARMGADRAFT_1093435 [Armillaria gallica]PBK83195.1 hypothetical protein ARMGADRAFT_1038001 [Armillaria gallica]PBK85173.1 hypothetical protein ARMGADRAFT_1036477 [Armillaria gallica]
MSTASPRSISSVAAVATAVTTTFVADRRSGPRLPTALSRPERGLATMAACLAIAMLVVITFLALKVQQLTARALRWESVGDDCDVLLGTPSDGTEYEAKKKELLSDVAGTTLARETQAGNVIPVDDTVLVEEGFSRRKKLVVGESVQQATLLLCRTGI